jgi:signal transduction histidine kinase
VAGLALLCPGYARAAEPAVLWSLPDLIVLAVVTAAGALGLAGGLWALAENQRAGRWRRALKLTHARARASLASREALIAAGREALIVWNAAIGEPMSFGGGAAMLERCLTGADATKLSTALDALSDGGEAFALDVRDSEGRNVHVRGRPAGGFAAVYMEADTREKAVEPDFRGALDALSIPVWVRGKDLALRWVNRAFLAATGAPGLDAALQSDVALDRTERDLASSVRAEKEAADAKRYAVVGGHRRALSFHLAPLADGGVAGSAIDTTALTEAEARLQQHMDAHADTLDKLATAVAIFGPDRKLSFYNRAYVRLWALSESWLDTHPTQGEIFDRLRELRRLPEQRDFQAWKRDRLKQFEKTEHHPEELWHLPGGKTLRVVAQPHPFGGLIFLFEDVSDQLRLESSYNTLIKVQKATLDTLQEGVAVFGPDGRLKLHNAAFTRLWRFDGVELDGEPHLKRLAETVSARFGRDQSWDIITSVVTAAAPERRREWGEVERSDGCVLSLSLAPLPDGATMVSFVDVTDRFRIETALRERNQALETTDNLKSEFVKRISYELRTPLNSIIGFAELLKDNQGGNLGAKQEEYVESIATASNTLRDLINDILDLSQIEAGTLELELETIDLYALLKSVSDHAREWAAKAGLALALHCREDAGSFVADGRRVRQVIFNLLSNSLKHTPKGGMITLGADIVGDSVQIYVADTGAGVAADVMPSAFERFSATGGSSGRAGAGLGLALVNRFVEMHNGWVGLESAKGTGTKVTCHFPRTARGRKRPSQSENRGALGA